MSVQQLGAFFGRESFGRRKGGDRFAKGSGEFLKEVGGLNSILDPYFPLRIPLRNIIGVSLPT